MWSHLQAEERDEADQDTSGSVRLAHLKVFLAAILNFNKPWMKHQEESEERGRPNPRRIGVHAEGRYTLSDEEIALVAKRFVLLHSARQDHLLNSKKEMHLAKLSQEPIEFRPRTDPKSKKILEKKDPKNELGQDLSYHDYLIQRGKQYKEKHQKLAEQKDGSSTDGCTFKPKILKKKLEGKVERPEANDKWMELYKMAEKKAAKDKRDVNHDEILLGKNPEEYTFQPNAHKYKNLKTARRAGASPAVERSQRLHETKTRTQRRQARERSEPPAQTKPVQRKQLQ